MTLNTDTLWFEIAFVCGIIAIGTILFGHFEEHASKLRKVLKLLFFNTVVVLLSYFLGRIWSFSFLGICLLAVVYIHAVLLPRKGINGWTAEPKDKYYEFRGWQRFLNKPTDDDKTGID